MRTFLLSFLMLFTSISVFAGDGIDLYGRVKESIGKTDLTDAIVVVYDTIGNVLDTLHCNETRRWNGHELITTSHFDVDVPRVVSTYVFEINCKNYTPVTFSYHLDKIKKRETYRDLGIFYLERAPRQLDELTVTASKIKFYNKGDTIVYNADAFQLAEGSMLDGLISQLPGVELSDDGQIKVNGEFVESLLLNGKEFFDGNNNLMLENIAAYTVKNVEVYKGQTSTEKYMFDNKQPQHLIMDVKLKKEYNMGWIVNAQGGGGTSDRYLGRLFASWFTNTTNVAVVGNVNNLNDNRNPGKNDTWTPDKMPSGTIKTRTAGITYNYQNVDETLRSVGDLSFEQQISENSNTTSKVNFLPDADTYDYSYGNSCHKRTFMSLFHDIRKHNDKLAFGVSTRGRYVRYKNWASNVSGTFGEEHQDMTLQALEALYSDGRQELLDNVLNCSNYRTDGWTKYLFGSIYPSLSFKLSSGDRLYLNFGASYENQKEEIWTERNINYGSDPVPAYRLRQFNNYAPNHTLILNAGLQYGMDLGKIDLDFAYHYSYTDKNRDSYMYALDRLEDAGIYGALPDNYLEAFDPANSFTSREIKHNHTFGPYLFYRTALNENDALRLTLNPIIEVVQRSLDYWRDNRDYHVSKLNSIVSLYGRWGTAVEYLFGRKDRDYSYKLSYYYSLDPTMPELYDMVDVTNDLDPLNVVHGNPDLKTEYKHTHTVKFEWTPYQKAYRNTFAFDIGYKTNALTNGYTYDTTTGARHSSKYNVGGNNFQYFSNDFSLQFGKTKQFTLSSMTNVNFSVYSDMIGINQDAPSMQKVNYNSYGEKLAFTWQIGKQSISVRGDWMTRHTSSARDGFNNIDATHLNYGINGVFKLPQGFGISTDFICYTRRGYGIDALDTTDPIWNARLSYCPPRNSRWVIMADGFDLLHKLNSVHYAVTAAGRTVSYSNTIPRYFLLTVQYRLNIQPKKK